MTSRKKRANQIPKPKARTKVKHKMHLKILMTTLMHLKLTKLNNNLKTTTMMMIKETINRCRGLDRIMNLIQHRSEGK